jgi:hypothetical protein
LAEVAAGLKLAAVVTTVVPAGLRYRAASSAHTRRTVEGFMPADVSEDPPDDAHRYPVPKPCWELNYCPYGYLVEQFPIPSMLEDDEYDLEELFEDLREKLLEGEVSEEHLYSEIERFLYLLPYKWADISDLDVEDIRCNVFGHTCPVFLTAEPLSETEEIREPASPYVPRDVLLQVVRRDGRMCQRCSRNLRDGEIEIDHVIPVSKGGPSRRDNLRVLCRDCNRSKSDSVDEFLADDWRGPPSD